jgi:ribose-phosphate pyrophosphokinase
VRIDGFIGQPIFGYKRAIIYDDEIATGGSMLEMSKLLIQQGIEEIWITCTHGIFTKGGLEKLTAIPHITEIVTTDTVYIPPEKRHPKLHILSVAPIFGEAIHRNYLKQSIGGLFVFSEDA